MWETVRLKEICTVFDDGDWIETKHQSEGGIRLIQTGNVKTGSFSDRIDKARYISEDTFASLKCTEIFCEDILVSRLPQPVGRACIIPSLHERAITAVDCTIIRVKKEKIIPEFLNYYMQSPSYFASVQNEVTGATRQRISRKKLGEIPVILPPLAEQQRIVAKLDAAFAEIDTAIDAAEKNAESAQDLHDKILDSLLIGFEGAKSTSIAEKTDMLSGFAFKSVEYTENVSDIPLLRGDNISPNGLDFENAKRFPNAEASNYSKFLLAKDDIVLGMDRPWISSGLRVAKLEDHHIPCLLVQRVMRMRAKDEIAPQFLYMQLKSSKFLKHILGNQSGLGVPHISGKTIGSHRFDLPSIEKQNHAINIYASACSRVDLLKTVTATKLQKLAALKSALLATELTQQSEAA
jgi:type I restriction enzyme, S subunit